MSGSRRPVVGKVFIGYRRDDTSAESKQLYDEVVAWLDKNGGKGTEQTFLDVESISPTRDYRRVLNGALAEAGVFIALIGPMWLGPRLLRGRRIDDENDPVRLEVEAAMTSPGTTVLPLLVRDGKMPPTKTLPVALREFSHCQAYRLPATDPMITPDIEKMLRESLNTWTAKIVIRKSIILADILSFEIQLTHQSHLFEMIITQTGEHNMLRITVDGEELVHTWHDMGQEFEWRFPIRDDGATYDATLKTRADKRFLSANRFAWVQLSISGYVVYEGTSNSRL